MSHAERNQYIGQNKVYRQAPGPGDACDYTPQLARMRAACARAGCPGNALSVRKNERKPMPQGNQYPCHLYMIRYMIRLLANNKMHF